MPDDDDDDSSSDGGAPMFSSPENSDVENEQHEEEEEVVELDNNGGNDLSTAGNKDTKNVNPSGTSGSKQGDGGGGVVLCCVSSSSASLSARHRRKVIDPFKFQAKAFTKVNTAITSAQRPSHHVQRKRGRTDDSGALERRLEELERHQRARLKASNLKSQQKMQKKLANNHDDDRLDSDDDDDNDNDDDSDLEVWNAGTVKEHEKTVRVGLDSSSKQQQNGNDVIELSSSDDEKRKGSHGSSTKTTSATVRLASISTTSRQSSARKPPINVPTRRSERSVGLKSPASIPSSVHKATTTTTTTPVYDCLSDSDDSDKGTAAAVNGPQTRRLRQLNTPLPAGAADAMKRARMAQSRLTQAQHYHAHDIYVKVDEPEVLSTSRRTRTTPASREKTSQRLSEIATVATNLGAPLNVTCRIQIDIQSEKRKRTQEVRLTIREQEPLQSLYDKIHRQLELPPTAKVTMTFDGMKLDKGRTPKSYDMENDDLIDGTATATATHLLAANENPTPNTAASASLGKRLKLVCRAQIKVTGGRKPKKTPALLTSKLEVREKEALSSLRDSMISAHNIPLTATVTMSFEGRVCHLDQTPAKYEMETDDLIDFTVEVTKLWYKV